MASPKTIAKIVGYSILKIIGTAIKLSVAVIYGPIEVTRNAIVLRKEGINDVRIGKSELQAKYNQEIYKEYNEPNNSKLNIKKFLLAPFMSIYNSCIDLVEDVKQTKHFISGHWQLFDDKPKNSFLDKLKYVLGVVQLIVCIPLIIFVDLVRIPLKFVRTVGNMFTIAFDKRGSYFYEGRKYSEISLPVVGNILTELAIVGQPINDVTNLVKGIEEYAGKVSNAEKINIQRSDNLPSNQNAVGI